MRSFEEIAFRLRQESANLRLWLFPPNAGHTFHGSLLLPKPDSFLSLLHGSAYEADIVRIAESILSHSFPLLGIAALDFGKEIRWRRDAVHGQETGTEYFRRIPYLDFTQAGDHKLIWELNRHQHLVLLAQAWLLTRRREFQEELERQIDHWIQENPFQCGINWTSALEVAFRALSWMWIAHWMGEHLGPSLLPRFQRMLYLHACHLEHNLSVYFSPNTHLLGEAVALHAMGVLFRGDRRAASWERRGAAIVAEEMTRQVRSDGSHFEQSTYYHVYALDMFLLHAVLHGDVTRAYRDKLARMAEYLDACLPESGALPLLGDDDGGRLFHPYGERPRFALGTLAAAGIYFSRPEWIRSPLACQEQALWLFGGKALETPEGKRPTERYSCLFPDTGMVVMSASGIHVLCDAGGFGPFSAGHSHADTLSLVASKGKEELLIDSGTFTYVSDPRLRGAFRGSAAHNTIRIAGLDQATPRNSFAWSNPPQVEILAWNSDAIRDHLDAVCRYSGFSHRRTCLFVKPQFLIILDRLSGPPGEHLVEQFWHLPVQPCALGPAVYEIRPGVKLVLPEPASLSESMRSRAFASREPSALLCVKRQVQLPVALAAALCFTEDGEAESCTLQWESPDVLRLDAGRSWRFQFPESGEARFRACRDETR